MTKIEKYVTWLEQIAKDDSHGYDQKNRQGVDYDCSSLVANGLYQAGFNVSTQSYTGNLYAQLLRSGFTLIHDVNDRKRGDIFLTPYQHVVTCVDGEKIVHASINEKGTTTGGKKGDQTGKEICVAKFYIPTYGWSYHFRYTVENEYNYASIDEIALMVIAGKFGTGKTREKNITSLGYDYKKVQERVNYLLKTNKNTTGKTTRDVAVEVIQGKWGSGQKRKDALTKAGYNYNEVQKMVNLLLAK